MNLDPSTARIRIEAARVAMAIPFRAHQDVRYYLNGVQITPSIDGGANICATDGHAAIVVRDVGGHCDRATILPINKGQLTLLRKGGHVMVNAEGTIWITDVNDRVLWISPLPEIDGKFPDLAGVIGPVSSYTEGLAGTFNPQLLDKIRQTCPRSKYARGVRFYSRTENPNSPALCSLGADGFVVVMPMHAEPAENGLAASIPADFVKAA